MRRLQGAFFVLFLLFEMSPPPLPAWAAALLPLCCCPRPGCSVDSRPTGQCVTSWMLVLCLGTLGERLEAKNSRQYPGLLAELARALPANALLGGWNSKTLLGGGAGAVVRGRSDGP